MRGTDCKTLKWFNETNINWWFDMFKLKLEKYAFARKPEAGEPGEMVWKDGQMERVLFSDETCVAGGQQRKASNPKTKCLTKDDRLEASDKGKGYRRVAVNNGSTQEHITLLASVSLAGEVAPGIWICAAANYIREESRNNIKAVVAKCGSGSEYSLPKFNNQVIDDVFIGTSPSGGITRDNITELFEKAVMAMYPDVANVDGKRVLWLTDWHDSRLSLKFIKRMREIGVIMIGWLPNITSKAQLADVALFGAMKSLCEPLEAKWANANPGKRIDRVAKIKIASDAMVKSFTRERIFKGAKLTGMNPIDRNALLKHPSISEGNVIFESTEKRMSTAFLSTAQTFDAPTEPAAGVWSPEPVLLDTHPLFDTPAREEYAESTFSSISQQKPRLGFRRLFADQTDDREAVERYRDQVETKLQAMIVDWEINQQVFADKKKESVASEIRQLEKELHEKQQQLAAAKKEYPGFLEAHKREFSLLKLLQKKLTDPTLDKAEIIAIVAEKAFDIENAQRDEFGLAAEKVTLEIPTTPTLKGINTQVVEDQIGLTAEHVLNKTSGVKRKANNDSSIPFKMGAIMSYVGEIEGTSDNMFAHVDAHKQKKAAEEAAKAAKAGATQAKKKQCLETLPQRFAHAWTELAIGDSQKTTTVTKCRAYLKVLTEKTKQEDNAELLQQLKEITRLKGTALTERVTALAVIHGPAPISQVNSTVLSAAITN